MFVVKPSINVSDCLDEYVKISAIAVTSEKKKGRMGKIQTHHGFGDVDGIGFCILGSDGVNGRLVANAGSLCDAVQVS